MAVYFPHLLCISRFTSPPISQSGSSTVPSQWQKSFWLLLSSQSLSSLSSLLLYHKHDVTFQMTEIYSGNESLWVLLYHLNCNTTPVLIHNVTPTNALITAYTTFTVSYSRLHVSVIYWPSSGLTSYCQEYILKCAVVRIQNFCITTS